ncbi:hypothetical protein [Hymenobacter fodinae]|uniref:Alpha/beta hydrolase family protein n=1 Tax=Hymenobacter fodinae TaxID=2510796 RepID=A0A4Z0PB00_9BACT|nr:hypothetical protein [Hymenobacter fodinae]TGE09805.1 hypothetical protein EU556_02960 [Hymenobacter fodinae]
MHPPDLLTEHTDTLPFQDHFLRVQHLRHPAPEANERPTLVFLHDSLGSIQLWRWPWGATPSCTTDAATVSQRRLGQCRAPWPT